MLLRTRVTLIVSVSYSLLAVGLILAGLRSEELANERYAQATLNGQEIFWQKLVENTTQRIERAVPAVTGQASLLASVGRRNPSEVREAMLPVMEEIRRRPEISRVEVVGQDGEPLYSSLGSLLETSLIDAGTVRLIVETNRLRAGIVQDPAQGFMATVSVPLAADAVVGLVTLAADLHPPLDEFKASTGSDIFLVDRAGQMQMGTDPELWKIFAGDISVRKSRLEMREKNGRFYSVVVMPLKDAGDRVIGALVTARDFTETQAEQNLIRQIVMATVAVFLVLVLGAFWVYLRKSFGPLNQAIAVLNALSRGDTSVSLKVKSDKDEIGRIAGTVGVFRENAIRLDILEERRERQRRRQELFIRLQMRKLSEMLDHDARQAVLVDLEKIEAMSQRSGDSAEDEAGKGELDVLAAAFQTMSDRIREQHLSLQDLIAQRTREAEILREALRTRETLAALRQELDFARELQLSSLPQIFPPFPDRTEFQLHAGMVPAKEVGGDFYDFFLIDHHHLGFVIGDASGKGVPAAMFIAITRSLIKAVAPLSASPGECLAFVNTMLSVDNPQTLFATVLYAVLDTRSGQVAFCNAGHPPALILRQGKEVEAIRDVSGVALGVMEDLEYESGSFILNPGDSILLYTDGVTEAQNERDELYDEPRLIARFGELAGRKPDEIIAAVHSSIETFIGEAPQFDDITMLALTISHLTEGGDETERPRHKLMLTGFAAQPAPETPPAPKPAASVKATVKPRVAKLKPKVETAPPKAQAPRLEVSIDNNLDELSRLAGLLEDFIAGNNLSDGMAFKLNLCLDELITNIVSYGFADDGPHKIQVNFVIDDGQLITEIIDEGKEYDPFIEAPEPDLELGVDDRPIGGLGVFLVKEFMDRTEYRREGGKNIVKLWKSTLGDEES